jgi:hypothetical protein
VLCGFVDIGGGIEIFFEGSLSPFVVGTGGVDSVAVFGTFPFVDATELLSPFESPPTPF